MTQDATQTTVIGPDAEISGDMAFGGDARVLGRFEGRITAKGVLEIGQGARCHAAVEAANIVVDGEVLGDVIAKDRVRLGPNARVKGDITAKTLSVSEGAAWEGRCMVGAAPEPTSRPATRNARAGATAVETKTDASATPDWLKAEQGASAKPGKEPDWLKRPAPADAATKDAG